MSAVNDKLSISRETTSSENIGPDLSNAKGLGVAQIIKEKLSRKIEDGSNENLPMFKLHLDETWQNSDGFCRRSTFWKTIPKENKTIMMIGATGAGKNTLINSMINYILGVQWEDDFQFVLIDEGKHKSQAESQTSKITAHQINHMDGFQVPYSLTIVDTPGFGDTRGISHDQKITAQIHLFFSARGGINCIDAVCFVVQASLARLTHTQKYTVYSTPFFPYLGRILLKTSLCWSPLQMGKSLLFSRPSKSLRFPVLPVSSEIHFTSSSTTLPCLLSIIKLEEPRSLIVKTLIKCSGIWDFLA